MRTLKMKKKSPRAFTLIELLVVVAIIAILAAIAVPNFLQAQTRSKVARVKSDLRTLALAIESYATDNTSYPPSPVLLGPRFRRFRPLTSPIAYITEIPRDPFKSIDSQGSGRWRTGLYGYGAMPLDNASRWALSSDGPDRLDDTNPIRFYPGYSPALFAGELEGFNYKLYDPTNGAISRGDIFRASDFNPEH
jgi:prepilin-type N-terminal cleavage/methylation domain-containing protein